MTESGIKEFLQTVKTIEKWDDLYILKFYNEKRFLMLTKILKRYVFSHDRLLFEPKDAKILGKEMLRYLTNGVSMYDPRLK